MDTTTHDGPDHSPTRPSAKVPPARPVLLDPERVETAQRLARTSHHSAALDRLSELAASLLGAGSAQVSVISDVQDVVSGVGAAAPSVGTTGPAADSLCTVTVENGAPLRVSDARADARVSHLPPVVSGAAGSYLGFPLVTAQGVSVGALCVFDASPREWTDQDVALIAKLAAPVLAELELAALSADFEANRLVWELAVDAAGVGAFDWDLLTGELRWDDRLLVLFGLDSTSFGGTIDAFNAAVHPDDLPRVSHALATAIEACADYHAEYRVVHPGGDVRWVAARGRAVGDRTGKAVRLLGAAYDTTAVQEEELRVARVLETMPTAFYQVDASWRFTYVNAEAERLLGRDREALLGGVLWDLFPAARDSAFERHYRGAVATGAPVGFDAYYPAPLDGWYEIRAWPSPDGLAVYFVEITARVEARERLERAAERNALAAEVNANLTETLDLEEAVSRLAAMLVPRLGDWCVVSLVEVHETSADWRRRLRDVGSWHADPALRPAVEHYARTRVAALTDGSLLAQALASGEPVVLSSGMTGSVADALAPGEAQEVFRELAPDAGVVVPMRGRGNVTTGALTVFRSHGRQQFSDEDLATLTDVAARAGLALDTARTHQGHRDLAEELQRSLLTDPPQPDHLEIVVRYQPAAQQAQVGGDWYDAFMQPDGDTVVVIGDVVGHDTAAAAAMGQVRGLLRGIAVHAGDGPAGVLEGVDRALQTLMIETTATALVARFEQTPDERDRCLTRFRWSNAGHPPPFVVHPDGTAEALMPGAPNLLLGFDPTTGRDEHVETFSRGATLLLYTDGLIERRGRNLDEGLAQLRETLEHLAARDLTLDDLCDQVLARMVTGRRDDDVALVAVRMHPEDGPRPAEAGPEIVPPDLDGDAAT